MFFYFNFENFKINSKYIIQLEKTEKKIFVENYKKKLLIFEKKFCSKMDIVCIFLSFLCLLLAFYYKYFLKSDYDDLTRIELIKDLDLYEKLVSVFNCPHSKCYLRAIDLLETYSNSTHLLFKIYEMTYGMADYEMAYSFLKKLEDLLPSNQNIKARLVRCKNKIIEQNNLAQEIEEEYYSDKKFQVFPLSFKKIFKYERFIVLNPSSDSDKQFLKSKTDFIQERLTDLKRNPQFREKLDKLKILWGIDNGKIEGLYDLSHETTKQLMKKGMGFDIIYHDNEDQILKFMTNGDRMERASEIQSIIEDNISVFEELETFIKHDLEMSSSMIKNVHTLFTKNARFLLNIDKSIHLIRRGKYKLFPNFIKNSDGNLILFSPPSRVSQLVDDLITEIQILINSGVNPIEISAFFHVNFIQIHPFSDGNGRVARAFTSLILLRNGLLPFNVFKEVKGIYIDCLESARDKQDYRPFIHFIIVQQLAMMRFLETENYEQYKFLV